MKLAMQTRLRTVTRWLALSATAALSHSRGRIGRRLAAAACGMCLLCAGLVLRAEDAPLADNDGAAAAAQHPLKQSSADGTAAVAADPVPRPRPVTPPAPEEIEAAIRRGVDFLLQVQNRDGSWGSAHRTKDLNVYAPVPGAHHGFRAAVSALCVSALIESGDARPDVQAAIDRGEAWLLEKLPQVRRATPDAIYNVWAHAYSIQALLRLLRRHEPGTARHQALAELVQSQFDFLRRYESVDGGWGYYDFRTGTQRPGSSSTSFVNATVLIAWHEARQAGFTLPQDVAERAVRATQRQLKPDFSYLYGEYLKDTPLMPVNRHGGSLGRSQACNLALRLWGDQRISDQVMVDCLDRLFARNLWLDIGRKRPIPHESWFQVAGYFFYYGHYYAALCLEHIPTDQRQRLAGHLAHVLVPLQEKDGSWWDYPLYNYHQQYGTAFAIMSLVRCRPTAGR